MLGERLFEVITPAANAAARRLTTVDAVTALMDEGDVPDDEDEVLSHIDFVSAQMARAAGLAADAAGNIPTFASETCRATWRVANGRRGTELALPWRWPITSITSVVEDGVALVLGTDFLLLPRAILQRVSSDEPVRWSTAKIVATYLAGWASVLSTTAPPELSGACAEQVKYRILSRETNRGVRSYTVNDLRAEAYNLPGGDSITKDGLLNDVDAQLSPYRNETAIFA